MFGDISFVTVTVCSFIPVVGFIAINYDKIANYLIKSLSYYPGEGEIYRKNNPKLKTNNFFIRNPEHDYRLNYIKTPSFDTSVCLFKGDIEIQDTLITNLEFFNRYGHEKKVIMQSYYMGIIDDIYHTSNFKKGKVYGYIKSLTDNNVYLFVIEEGTIDFRKVFKDYEKEIEDHESDNF